MLLVRSTGDEASAALGAPQFLSSLISSLLNLAVLLIPPLDSKAEGDWVLTKPLKMLFYISIPLAFLPFVFPCFFLQDSNFNFNTFCWLSIFPILINFIIVGLVFMSCVVIYFCVIVLSFLMIPFGISLAISGASLRITAEGTPPGEWTVVQAKPDEKLFEHEIGMQHFTHSSPFALKLLEDWLRPIHEKKLLG